MDAEFHVIDVQKEQLLAFGGEAPESFPGHSRLSLATLHRWRLHGIRGVRLPTCVVGHKRFTSREAIQWFLARLNAAETPKATVTPQQRKKQAEAAREALRKSGV